MLELPKSEKKREASALDQIRRESLQLAFGLPLPTGPLKVENMEKKESATGHCSSAAWGTTDVPHGHKDWPQSLPLAIIMREDCTVHTSPGKAQIQNSKYWSHGTYGSCTILKLKVSSGTTEGEERVGFTASKLRQVARHCCPCGGGTIDKVGRGNPKGNEGGAPVRHVK